MTTVKPDDPWRLAELPATPVRTGGRRVTVTQDQAADFVRRGAYIRVHSGAVGLQDHVMAEGKVIAWCVPPSLTIVHEDGTRSSWPATLPITEIEAPAPVAANPGEPENGSYVAVRVEEWDVWVFRRNDTYAAAEQQPERRWVLRSYADPSDRSDRTWAEVCRLGPVAYVGVFVDRSVKEAA